MLLQPVPPLLRRFAAHVLQLDVSLLRQAQPQDLRRAMDRGVLLLGRHLPAEGHGTYLGSTCDQDLSADGLKAADVTGELLRQYVEQVGSIDVAWTSHLKRGHRTAKLVLERRESGVAAGLMWFAFTSNSSPFPSRCL